MPGICDIGAAFFPAFFLDSDWWNDPALARRCRFVELALLPVHELTADEPRDSLATAAAVDDRSTSCCLSATINSKGKNKGKRIYMSPLL